MAARISVHFLLGEECFEDEEEEGGKSFKRRFDVFVGEKNKKKNKNQLNSS